MARRVIQTDKAAAPVAAYSQGIAASGTFIFVSGQVGIDPTTKALPESVEEQTTNALNSVQAILEAAGASLKDVVKVTVYLHDINDYAAMNGVYAQYFTDQPPARAAFGGNDLPIGARVEVECIAVLPE